MSSPLCLNASMNSGGDGEFRLISHVPPPVVNQGEHRVRRFKRICFFCGAGLVSGLLGRELGVDGSHLQTVHHGGQHVLGAIPRAFLLPHELLGQTLGEVKIVADTHQRKSEMEMAKHADAFVALLG